MASKKFYSTRTMIGIIGIIFLLSVVLSACGTAEMDVTVYSGDKFDMKLTILIPNDTLQMMGGAAELEAQLDELVMEAKAEDMRVTWKEVNQGDSNTTGYEITFPKTDMNEDIEDLFTWREVRYDNRDAYRIEFIGLSDVSSMFMSFTLNLKAGKILDSNGTKTSNSSVTWVNPSQTPFAIVTVKGAVSWIPLILSVLTIGALAVAVIILLVSGKLKEWGTAGVNAGKWKIQASKLSREKKKIEDENTGLVQELGKKAWEARVLHHSYTEPYFELESLERQLELLEEKTKALSTELEQTQAARSKTNKEFSNQIGDLQAKQKEVAENLNQAKSKKAALAQELVKIEQYQAKSQNEIQGYRSKLVEVEASDLPDKDHQAASLNNAISTLEQSLASAADKVPDIEEEISKLQAELKPLEDQITNLGEQISEAQTEKKNTLTPIDQTIAELEEEIKSKKEEFTQLKQQMAPIISRLGPLVDSARPESEDLAEIYSRIDKNDALFESISQEHDLVTSRIETSDKSAVRNFYLTIAGIVILVVVIVGLLIIAFV